MDTGKVHAVQTAHSQTLVPLVESGKREDLAGCCDKGECQQTTEYPGGHETGDACPAGFKCLEV